MGRTASKQSFTKTLLLTGAAALFIAAPPMDLKKSIQVGTLCFGKAHAETDGSGGKGKQGAGGDTMKRKGAGAGKGGPSADSDAKGPKARQPGAGDRGGKPAWAQEGLPVVELGRLNVARSPQHVLDHALAEAVANWDAATMAAFYSLSATDAAAFLLANPDILRIDSPLENLALFQDILVDDATQLTGLTPASSRDLAAIFLGSASDKTIAVSNDTVTALNTLLSTNIDDADIPYIATGAEAVRSAILTVHGD